MNGSHEPVTWDVGGACSSRAQEGCSCPNNLFNPVNQYHPDNPLNPANTYNPDVTFAPLDGGYGTEKTR